MTYDIYDKMNQFVTRITAQKHELKQLASEFGDCFFYRNGKMIKI